MTPRNTKLVLMAGAALVPALPAFARKAAMQTPPADKQFMLKAAQGGLGEVSLGALAQAHGSRAGVKQFGRRMVADHSRANAELKQVAAGQGVTLPGAPGPEERATKARLSRLSGASFDKAYVSDMVEDHEKDIADFSKEAATGKDPAVRGFAAKTLPTLKMHLQMVHALQGSGHGR